MAIFRSHDLQTKRCLTFCRVPLWNLAHPYGSGRVAAYTPNVHSLPLSSQAQSNHGCDLWLHILGKQKSRSMKLYDRRIGFLFCGILTVCTARIFHAKCPTSCDDKTTKYSAFTLIIHADREKSTRFHAFNHQFLMRFAKSHRCPKRWLSVS